MSGLELLLGEVRGPRPKRAVVVVLLLGLLASSTWAQGDLASIEAELQTATGLERAEAIARLVDIYRNQNPQRAVDLGEEALEILSGRPDPGIEVRVLNEMAWSLRVLGRYREALELADRSRGMATLHGDQVGLARAHNNTGIVYWYLGDFDRALEHWFENLAAQELLDDRNGIAGALNNIGLVHSSMNDPVRAMDYFSRALEISEQTGNQEYLLNHLDNLGEVQMALGESEQALASYQRALRIAFETENRKSAASILVNLGRLHRQERRFSESLAALEQGRDLAEQVGVRSKVAEGLLGLAATSFEMGRSQDARIHGEAGLEIALELAEKAMIRDSYEFLSKLYGASGEHERALGAFRSFKSVHDEMRRRENDHRVLLLEHRFDAQQREREIALLRTQNEIQQLESSRRQLELDRQKLQRNAALGMAVFVALLGMLAYWRRYEKNVLAERLSLTDSLTGLRNRRFVQHAVELDLASSRRVRNSEKVLKAEPDVVFLLIDIDHFKAVNDRFGHGAGDRVLVQFAELLGRECRSSDTITRWGGEEFLVLGRFGDREEARGLASRILSAVEKREFELEAGQSVRCSCSIGLAAFPFFRSEPEALGWEQIVALADEALYAAKRSGRNAWVSLSGNSISPHESFDGGLRDQLARWIENDALEIESSRSVEDLRWSSAE